jgi:hypothetical protein
MFTSQEQITKVTFWMLLRGCESHRLLCDDDAGGGIGGGREERAHRDEVAGSNDSQS